MSSSSVHLPWTTHNQLELLNGGSAFFPALLTAIEHAQHEIFLESYIFAEDAVGHAVIAALIAAAQRGVHVHLLVDGFGARHFPQTYGETLRQAQVRFQIYRPEQARWLIRRHRLRRLHRKLAVIDRKIAFVGGINIIDDANTPPHFGPRADFAVQATGPVAVSVLQSCLRLWAMVARSGFQAQLRHWSRQWLREYRSLRQNLFRGPDQPPEIYPAARFLPRDNIRFRQTIVDAYLAAIQSAETEIVLAHAYFLPALRIRHALRDAAQRGVKVRLLLQGSSDHRLLQYATRALYGYLLRAGIELHEYTAGFLHGKVGIVDGQWATVGSSNLDPFSLELAQEGNLEIIDTQFARQLRAAVLKLIAEGSTPITLNDLRKASGWSRLNRWLAYGLVRLLIALAGYGRARGMR